MREQPTGDDERRVRELLARAASIVPDGTTVPRVHPPAGRSRRAKAALVIVPALIAAAAIVVPLVALSGNDSAVQRLRTEPLGSPTPVTATTSSTAPAAPPPPTPTAHSTATPPATPPSSTRPPSRALSRCHTDDVIARTGVIGAAAGNEGTVLTLTNTSHHRCTLYGYVGLQRLNAAHQPVATTLTRGPSMLYRDPGPHQLTLDPGATASAGIGWHGNPAGNETESSCRASSYLDVTLPEETTHLVTPTHPVHACGGDLTVTALQKGSTPERS